MNTNPLATSGMWEVRRRSQHCADAYQHILQEPDAPSGEVHCIEPWPGITVNVNGKPYRIADLPLGQSLTVYLNMPQTSSPFPPLAFWGLPSSAFQVSYTIGD